MIQNKYLFMILKKIVKFCDFIDRVVVKFFFESVIVGSFALIIAVALCIRGIILHRFHKQ